MDVKNIIGNVKKKEKYRHDKGMSLQTNVFLVHDRDIRRGKIKARQPE